VAWAPVDALNGACSVALRVNATAKTAYALNPTALIWTADTAVAERHTVEASSAGILRTQDFDTTAGVPPLSFIFS